jgi:hypothetical protein
VRTSLLGVQKSVWKSLRRTTVAVVAALLATVGALSGAPAQANLAPYVAWSS